MTGTALCAALLLLGATKTGSDVPSLERSSPHTKRVHANHRQLFAPVWEKMLVRTGIHRQVSSASGSAGVSVASNTAVIGTLEGVIWGLDLQSGAVKWRLEEPAAFSSNVSVLPGGPAGKELALIASDDGVLRALAVADGAEQWRVELGGVLRAPALGVDGTAIVSSQSNRLMRVGLATGTILWTAGRSKPTRLSVDGHSGVAVGQGRVYAAFSDGYVEAYSLDSGEVAWSRQISVGGQPFPDVDADPVLVDSQLFVASYSDGVYALEASSGKVNWQRKASAVTTLADAGDQLVVGSADGYLWGLEYRSGRRRFRTLLPSGPVTRIQVRSGRIVIGAGETGIVAIDAESGRPLQAAPIGSRVGGDVAWVGSYLLVLAESGRLLAYRATEPVALLQQPGAS